MKISSVLISFALLLCGAPVAHAIGDSGGCGDPLGGPLGRALRTGAPNDVKLEIDRTVDYKERNLSLATRAAHRIVGAARRQEWRRKQILNLIEGDQEKDSVCVPGPLLPAAVHAGNLEVVRFLLNRPMGVDPRVGSSILFSCNDGAFLTDSQISRRRQAFKMILDSRAIDLNSRNSEGRTLLQACYASELLELFALRGAHVDVQSGTGVEVTNLLEQAILDAVGFKENTYTARRLNGVARAKLFATLVNNSIQGRPVESRVRHKCDLVIRGERWNPETCRSLATFVKATPGTFGE